MQQLFLSAVVHFVKNINVTHNNKLYTSVINKPLMPACITIFNVDKRKTKNELSNCMWSNEYNRTPLHLASEKGHC